jgi:hypothetical protein
MVAQVVGRLLLTGVSVTFIVGGAADPVSFGGVLFLLLGVAGVALFGSDALVLTGNLVARRPVLEIDDEGIRRPAGWPRRASKLLRWDDLAAVGAWSQGIAIIWRFCRAVRPRDRPPAPRSWRSR